MLTCVPRASGIMLIVSAKDGVVGVNLPPLYACTNAQRRCYFRPSDVSVWWRMSTWPCSASTLHRWTEVSL